MQLPPSRGSLIGIQALRFIAALLVVVMHASESAVAMQGSGDSWGVGGAGVHLFFVISGLVMALSAPAHAAGWALRMRNTRVFVQRRIARIVPMYWLFTTLKIVLVLALPALALRTKLDPAHVLASYFFVPMAAPWGRMEPVLPVGWTLVFEMFFYAVFALAIALGLPRMLFCTLVFLAIAALQPAAPALAYYANPIVFEFVLGMLVARLLQRGWLLPARWALPALAAGFYLLFDRWLTVYGAVFLIVWAAVSLEPAIRRLPGLAPVSALGDASYAIYLSHPFTVPLVTTLLVKVAHLPFLAAVGLAALASLLVGWGVYACIESRLTSRFGATGGARGGAARASSSAAAAGGRGLEAS